VSEVEKEIQIPMSERVRLEDLKFDGSNPNRLSREGMERLKASIRKWGDIVPIVTNKDLLVADGEQRALAMKELGMTECSVIRLPVKDVDRRLLRQVLNIAHAKETELTRHVLPATSKFFRLWNASDIRILRRPYAN
jgi:ParB-like chromosome segregation protein Spo0J